ncbi:hypothetical protein VB834_19520 [Limnoraphis robusta Tam1]|uniref:Uncharacterized protein n=1 Tax=Limnoraphis robusta CS-951 TaxID=1637645 RepID=A0A0J9EW01_9CYAN|nr:hypothetical protein [Limnoraphis robusta]KMW70236.1 hypothetical protein WN50_36720 [Limnoraphis robusta CS-951]MEA5501459.1 hypothetical protein [Limnoraphis robusta BA-68 BA1]MEA5541219.1 hypothetical protein [Limnoraphis robusta Tam1]
MALISIPERIDRRVSFWLGCTGLLSVLSLSPKLDILLKTVASSTALGCSILAYDTNHKNKPIAISERQRVDSELNVLTDFITAQETSQTEEIQYDLLTQIEQFFNRGNRQSEPTVEQSSVVEASPVLSEVIEPKLVDEHDNN